MSLNLSQCWLKSRVLIIIWLKNIKSDRDRFGWYIIQNSNEPPSHIIAPAIHKSKQVSELFSRIHKQKTTNVWRINPAARKYKALLFNADMGITGANFWCRFWFYVIVTNEGNGRMTNIFLSTCCCD